MGGQQCRLAILSDVHYAGRTEQSRGNDYEYRCLPNPFLRLFCRYYRRYIWLRDPVQQNHLLDRFLDEVAEPDYVFALGDYNCDTAFVGVSDDAAFESAAECLGKLRGRYGDRFHAIIGDHDLGKFTMFGQRGGMRLASWKRVRDGLELPGFWRFELGNHVFMGLTSSLIAFPSSELEALPEERAEWHALRREHLAEIETAFRRLKPEQRVILFCHDPSALAHLHEEEAVRERLGQVERTWVGHLHTPLILAQSRLLAGMPTIGFLGHTARRLSRSLNRARRWKPFHVSLCPSLAGVELLKDGGYYTGELNLGAPGSPVAWQRHRLPR